MSPAPCWPCCLSALVAWALARRIVGPVAVASNVAERIAAGKLDVAVPKGSADELGALLAVDGRHARQHQGDDGSRGRAAPFGAGAACRRAGKLAGRRRGGRCRRPIALANAQAADLLGVAASLLKPGTSLAQLEPALQGSAGRRTCGDALRSRLACDTRSFDGGRALAAHQPQPHARSGLHLPVQRYQPAEAAGIVAARKQYAARRRAGKHVAGSVPLRCAEPARSLQPALPGNLQTAAGADQARHHVQGSPRDQRPINNQPGRTVDAVLEEQPASSRDKPTVRIFTNSPTAASISLPLQPDPRRRLGGDL